MIAATYDLQTDRVRVLVKVNAPALWSVRIWVREGDKFETSFRTSQRCHLTDLLPMAHAAARELIDKHPGYTAGGFTVQKLR